MKLKIVLFALAASAVYGLLKTRNVDVNNPFFPFAILLAAVGLGFIFLSGMKGKLIGLTMLTAGIGLLLGMPIVAILGASALLLTVAVVR